MNNRTRLIKVSALAVLLVACRADAEQATPSEGERLLHHFVSDVQTMSGRFEQQLVDANDNLVEEANGTLSISKPGRFRWSYSEPYEQILIADGLNIWSYDVDLAQVTVKPQQELLGSTPAALLGGGGDVLDDFDYIGSSTDRGTVWVRLQPKSADNGFTRVELGFNDGTLRRLIFADNLEQTTLIALFDVDVNSAIAEDVFRFSPPADADLVGVPISPESADL
ncbi:MAG: outer membrane lipoprotein chaperone LolA [Gammaproteobacteria bacterium]|nr:outer membrane lipoprotein chaperone LolA [Gammaproteobacteria bacterium]